MPHLIRNIRATTPPCRVIYLGGDEWITLTGFVLWDLQEWFRELPGMGVE